MINWSQIRALNTFSPPFITRKPLPSPYFSTHKTLVISSIMLVGVMCNPDAKTGCIIIRILRGEVAPG